MTDTDFRQKIAEVFPELTRDCSCDMDGATWIKAWRSCERCGGDDFGNYIHAEDCLFCNGTGQVPAPDPEIIAGLLEWMLPRHAMVTVEITNAWSGDERRFRVRYSDTELGYIETYPTLVEALARVALASRGVPQ